MLERGVEVDVVGDREGQHRLDVVERDRVAGLGRRHSVLGRAVPRLPALRQERVEAARGEVDDAVAGAEAEPRLTVGAGERPESLDHRIPSSVNSSTGSKNEQLPTATSCSRRTRASSAAPALRSPQRSASGVSETAPSSAVSSCERARGEDVQKAVPLVGRQRVVQAGRRLERNTRVAADSEEAPELRARGDLCAAAAHLRAQAALGQLGHPRLELFVQRQFHVRLACQALEARRPARLDRLGTRIPAVRPVDEHRQRPVLALELVEARGRPDEPREQPRVVVGAGAAILVERVRHRQARRWEERRVVDEVREGRAARVAHRLSSSASAAASRSSFARATETLSRKPGRLIRNGRLIGGSCVRPASTTRAVRYVPSWLGWKPSAP